MTVAVQMWRLTSNISSVYREAAAFRAIHITNEKQAKNKPCASYATTDHKLSCKEITIPDPRLYDCFNRSYKTAATQPAPSSTLSLC